MFVRRIFAAANRLTTSGALLSVSI